MAQTILELQLKGVKTARQEMDRLSESIVEQKKKQRELRSEIKELEKSLDGEKQMSKETMDALADKNLQLVASRKKTSELNSELKQNIRLYNSQEGSLNQARASAALLAKEIGNIDRSTEEGRKTYEKTEQQLADLTKQIKEQESAFGDNRRNVGNYEEAIKDAVGSMIPFGGQLTEIAQSGGGVKGALSMITTGIQGATRAAIAFIATPIGAAIAALAAIGTATKAFFDYNAEVQKTNALISGLTNESGALVDQIRIQSDAIAQTLGVEQEQLVQSAKVLVQQFGISYDEALTKIQDGLLATNGANDEFLQSIGEYSTFFSDAGYSVEEFANIVNAGFDLGIYSDKLPDALKEADISLREQTKATREALTNAFGEDFTTDILNQINSGALSTKEALELMSQEAENVGLSAEQAATLTADVFRGAGEDAGGALKVFEAVNVSLSDTTSELDEQGKRMEAEIARQQEVAEARDRAFNSEGVQSFMKVLKDLGAFFQKSFFLIIEGLGFVINEGIIVPIQNLIKGFNKLKDAAASALSPLKSIASALGITSKETDKATQSSGQFTKMIEQQKQAAEEAAAAQAQLEANTKAAEQALKDAKDRADDYVKSLRDIVDEQARQPLLMQAEDIFSKRSAEEITRNLEIVANKLEENANYTRVNVEGISLSVEEYTQLAQDALSNLEKAEKDAQEASEKRNEERKRQRLKDAEEEAKLAQKALEDQLKLEEEERLANQKRIDDNIKAVKDNFDERLKAIDEGLKMELLVMETAHLNELRNFQGTEEEKLAILKAFQMKQLQLQKDAIVAQIQAIEEAMSFDTADDLLAGLDAGVIDESSGALAELRNALAAINIEIDNLGKDEEGEPKTIAQQIGLDPDNIEKALFALDTLRDSFAIAQQAIGAAETARLKEVDKQVEQGVITEEQAEAKRARISKKAAKQQQAVSIIQAMINVAQGITKALASLPPPFGQITAATIAAQGAVQIATIKSQKFAKGGILNGPSHEQGGIPMFSKGGAFYGEAEGGEAVMTKGVMANPALASMASAINVAGGGVPFFANGGVLDPIQSATPTDRAADIIASGLKSRQPVLVVEQLRERENSVDVIESLRTIG